MKTLLPLSIAVFAVLAGLSTLDAAPVNITLPCGSGMYFSLQADRISASMGATDASSWEVDQLQVGSQCTMSNPPRLVAELNFNTTQPNVTLALQAEFTMYPPGTSIPGSWNSTYFMATVNSVQKETPASFIWNLPPNQLAQVDWLNSAERTKGKRCSHGEVVLNAQNKLGLDNFHFFPGTVTTLPLNDDSYNLCVADQSTSLGGLAWWAWLLIILGVLIVLGGLGFGGYSIYQRRHS